MIAEIKNEKTEIDIDLLWEICLSFEYDYETLLQGIEDFLKPHIEKDILDCACGTGFITLDLIKKGYLIKCSDGSKRMIDRFVEKARSENVSIKPEQLKWDELSSHYWNSFDIVMCRGSSLIYAGGWDNKLSDNREIIFSSLKNFYECLKPGGFLYVDTTSSRTMKRTSPEYNIYQSQVINGLEVKLEETIKTDREKQLRIWEPIVTINNVKHSLLRYSYYLLHSELKEMLKACGFSKIEKKKISGEHYDVFIAHKPLL